MEDAPDMNTYNYFKKGFSKAPTDYYLRPFFKAIDSEVKQNCYLNDPDLKVIITKYFNKYYN